MSSKAIYNFCTSVIIQQNVLSCKIFLEGGAHMYIYRASMRTKDGTVIYARNYGKKAFKIWISGPKKGTVE